MWVGLFGFGSGLGNIPIIQIEDLRVNTAYLFTSAPMLRSGVHITFDFDLVKFQCTHSKQYYRTQSCVTGGAIARSKFYGVANYCGYITSVLHWVQ